MNVSFDPLFSQIDCTVFTFHKGRPGSFALSLMGKTEACMYRNTISRIRGFVHEDLE